MKKVILAFLLAVLAGPSGFGTAAPAQAADEEAPPVAVSRPNEAGSDIDPLSYQGDIHDRSLAGASKGLFKAALVGRYLDEEPARQLVAFFQSRGLTAFALRKEVTERRLLKNDPVGHFYLVMVGLFGEQRDADFLGQRLRAEGTVRDYRILSVDAPRELEATEAQNRELYLQSARVSEQSRERASRPLDPNSPSATGQAFKKHVYGRYIGSYRDPLEARDMARRMTTSGWSASVENDGGWYRVYLAPTKDHRDFKADGPTLKAARKSAASQPGLVFLADLSGLKGTLNPITPNAGRTDASACAGFSEAGRLGTVLTRTMIYIPDTSYTVALTSIRPPEKQTGWKDIPKRVKAWWDDEKSRPVKKADYGPAIYNRPEMEKAISRLTASPDQASLAIGLTEAATQLSTVPGRKVLLVFSEFQGPDQPRDVQEAVSRLKAAYGSSLEVLFIYGDTDGPGYDLAATLTRDAGGSQPWDGCRLISDNAYFESYIKTIFH